MRLTRLLLFSLFGLLAAGALHAQSSTTATILRPYITSISPQVLVTGVDSTVLTIYGKRFQRGAEVFFNARKLTNTRLEGDSVLVVVIPGELATYPDMAVLMIENPDETKIGLRVSIRPGACSPFGRPSERFGGIQPTVTTASTKPFTVQVLGVGFAGNIRIVLGGVELLVLSTSSTLITAQVPAAFASGVHWLQVIQREVCILGEFLFVNPYNPISAPAITRVVPFGFAGGGIITIIGINFSTQAVVRLNSTILTITDITGGRITAIVPTTFRYGSFQLSITNPDGQLASTTWGVVNSVEVNPNITTLYPNPATTALTLETTLDRAATLTLTLRNVMGASVLEERHTAASGRFSTTLDVSALASGVYVLEVSDGVGRWAQKVVKY
jgi:hypothetical protein